MHRLRIAQHFVVQKEVVSSETSCCIEKTSGFEHVTSPVDR